MISKKIFLKIISICIFFGGIAKAETKEGEQAMQFVRLVQKRYYLVHRLEKPIGSLIKLYESITKKDIFDMHSIALAHTRKSISFPTGISSQFKHPQVIKYMQVLEREHDMSAINNLWSDFLSYKYIEDELFIRETIIAIMIVYRVLVVHLNSSVQKDLLLIEKKNMGNGDVYEDFSSILNLLDEPYDKEDFVVVNNLRYYHIQRLLKSILILTKVNAQYLNPLWDCLTHTIHNNAITFQHTAVQQCLNAILQTQSLEPLFHLWRHFMAYKFANDSLFLQEFVTLEYMLYRKLIDCLHIMNIKKSPTAEDLIELYATVAALPIPDMLNSLDTLVEELIVIIGKYELDSSMNWTQWIKKYWWVPPVIVASIVVNFLLGHREPVPINP